MSRVATPGACATIDTSKLEASLPEGFQTQLNDVVRAILLTQPLDHIYCFVAEYLEAQVDDRARRELEQDQPPRASIDPPTSGQS